MPSFSRRQMLAAVAAAGGASRLGPFLPKSVYAAGAPKRILTIFSPLGYLENSFWPSGTGASFTLGETMSALNPWKSKLLYLDGLTVYGPQWYFPNNDDNEHANGGNMVFTGSKKTGYSLGPSIEQAVADHQYGQVKTQYRALALGVNAGTPSPHTGVFFSKAQTPVTAQNSAQATFDMLFKNFAGPTLPGTPSTPGAPTPPATVDSSAADRARKQDQAVLNSVKSDLSRIRVLAGRDDRDKVDAHLDGISSLENRIKLMSGTQAPTKPAAPTPSTPPVAAGSASEGCAKPALAAAGSIEARTHAQMDLIAAAFACDLTRSASLQLGICDGGMDEAVPGVDHHGTTHAVGDKMGQATDIDNHKKYDRWFAARWAYLLGRLDSIKEGNGTLLDNTLIVFGSDTTTLQVQTLGPHNHSRFPLWMAGGGNFAFKTGQSIKLPTPATLPGSPAATGKFVVHQRLLTSICQAFGMGVESFGTLDPGKGPVAQLQRV